ncbi:MAG: PepSY domain-containing protein [Proteobacteria bacterium]|nr:PepSY domain-containing protein [Pseudomonadota bacterium]
MLMRPARCALILAIAACALVGEAAWAHGGDRQPEPPRQPPAYQPPPPPHPQSYPQPYRQPQPQQQRAEPYGGSAYGGPPRDYGLPASVNRIQRETGGQVLRAQPYERDGREVYRVKVLTPQGRIRVYEEDPGDAGHRGPPALPSQPLPPPGRPPSHRGSW